MNKYKDNSCTIYQFGLDEIDKKFYGYVYRQEKAYESEEIIYGLGVKPPDVIKNENGECDLKFLETEKFDNFNEIF